MASLGKPQSNTNSAKGDTYSSIENLTGSDHADRLTGNGAANHLDGGSGNDVLTGGGGADQLRGGDGTDTASYLGARKGVVANIKSSSGGTNDARGDTYSSIENLTGSAFSDTLTGNNGWNRISAGAGNDKLYGGLGKDVLIGGSGRDTFVFNTEPGKQNIDTIDDFSVWNDVIWLDNDVFTKAGKIGDLSSKAFHIGVRAHDKDDRVIYDGKSGKLWYDADGTGSTAAIQLAVLDKKLKMTASDFDIIG